jgi:hypothetical protein
MAFHREGDIILAGRAPFRLVECIASVVFYLRQVRIKDGLRFLALHTTLRRVSGYCLFICVE